MNFSNGSIHAGESRIGFLVVLAGLCFVAVALFSASSAKAATVGDPVAVDFNYAGININTALAGINELVLTPDAGLGGLELRGTYTDADGSFTVPEDGGLTFPDLALDIGVDLEAQIGLIEDADGTYNSATGAMTFNPSIFLTIGVSDVAGLPLPGLGNGPLRCELAPLTVAFSTSGGWPAPGNTFDPGAGTLKNGAVSGAWDVKPDIIAREGSQSTCDLIGGLLEPVGGLWLAQSDTPIASMPAATAPAPPPAVCGDDFTGTPPNCVAVEPPTPAKVGFSSRARSVTILRGRSGVVRVTVRNSGEASATSVKVCGTISARFAKAPKCVSLGTIAGGASKNASLRLTAGKRAKGKTTLRVRVTAAVGGSAALVAPITIR
ncbi:MAG: hypothetical protein WEB05_01070 [Solirubrobacterales bacterium]